ncbi:hypothetical protein SERLA73DRAFT_175532 [Serpula lacrymans var. lacrymans S7.3]|uniref:Thiaminase-2/PQQC domain-containing protein n=2 Tax=Serpula lacrymans var. lacrymans TaxID=341189 RepID=F8PKD7_SERL3|nr:uncharacterized protein SERLADRAFT_458027 [Serpula lacrymans var. lacrymans S7.9]EGO03851.1 hypothetical protein SERLA73DRAFT_175532 [Serpula lacrymans var. lacrymans S7.3]EGO29776.1 hypothetical protein SERLADRAFT_458027 [Serpula lacrymans var. lacrymans S7.9]
MSTSTSLASHLSSLSTPRPYSAATEHAFLTAAGDLSLPRSRLALWLAQDRIYAAHAYPRFIGLLIAKIPFDSAAHVGAGDKIEGQNRHILKLLVASLENVVREVGFFDDIAKQWNLEIGTVGGEGRVWVERKATRDYTAEMARVASLGSLEDGLVFLWAMERAYLDAWRYVKSQLSLSSTSETTDGQTAGAIRALTNNWTTPDFVDFVDELAKVMDACFVGLSGDSRNEAWARAEEIWARVVELEEAFWPEEGEETSARIAP